MTTTSLFATKGNNRVWMLHCASDEIEIVYDLATSSMPALSNVDNVFAGPNGDVYVSEDLGNLQIVALTPLGNVKPFVRIVGQADTEVTGPALNPDGARLYFSSQRNPGTTYEVRGPFLGPTQVSMMGDNGQSVLLAALSSIGTRRLSR